MKTLVCFVALFLVIGLRAQNGLVDSIITKELLYKHVSALAHDTMMGRYSGSKANIKAGVYIAKQFEEMELSKIASLGAYGSEVIYNRSFYGYNILGVIDGMDTVKKDTLVIFTAHYDHIGGSYNGANDNASGTASLLALAKYYKALHNNDYTLLFVAFTGEELGMIGSKVLVKELDTKLIKLNINLEMLGRTDGKNSKPYIVSALKNNFSKVLSINLETAGEDYPKAFFKNDPYVTQNLERRSDHFSFNENKIPAFTIMLSSPTDIHYHQTSDEISILNFDTMLNVVQFIAIACSPLLK